MDKRRYFNFKYIFYIKFFLILNIIPFKGISQIRKENSDMINKIENYIAQSYLKYDFGYIAKSKIDTILSYFENINSLDFERTKPLIFNELLKCNKTPIFNTNLLINNRPRTDYDTLLIEISNNSKGNFLPSNINIKHIYYKNSQYFSKKVEYLSYVSNGEFFEYKFDNNCSDEVYAQTKFEDNLLSFLAMVNLGFKKKKIAIVKNYQLLFYCFLNEEEEKLYKDYFTFPAKPEYVYEQPIMEFEEQKVPIINEKRDGEPIKIQKEKGLYYKLLDNNYLNKDLLTDSIKKYLDNINQSQLRYKFSEITRFLPYFTNSKSIVNEIKLSSIPEEFFRSSLSFLETKLLNNLNIQDIELVTNSIKSLDFDEDSIQVKEIELKSFEISFKVKSKKYFLKISTDIKSELEKCKNEKDCIVRNFHISSFINHIFHISKTILLDNKSEYNIYNEYEYPFYFSRIILKDAKILDIPLIQRLTLEETIQKYQELIDLNLLPTRTNYQIEDIASKYRSMHFDFNSVSALMSFPFEKYDDKKFVENIFFDFLPNKDFKTNQLISLLKGKIKIELISQNYSDFTVKKLNLMKVKNETKQILYVTDFKLEVKLKIQDQYYYFSENIKADIDKKTYINNDIEVRLKNFILDKVNFELLQNGAKFKLLNYENSNIFWLLNNQQFSYYLKYIVDRQY